MERMLRFFFFSEQIKSLGTKLKDGDVILSNHPCAGGSHLPDLTVITPVSLSSSLSALPLSSLFIRNVSLRLASPPFFPPPGV